MLRLAFRRLYSLTFSPLFVSLPLLSIPASPQWLHSAIQETPPLRQVLFNAAFEPPGEPAPPDTRGAGSRGENRCATALPAIRPLMPERNFGLTFESHPAIFVALPASSAQQVVLVFQDESGEFYERAFLPVNTDSDQVASFRLPDGKPPLAIGKNYRWSLVVVCGETVQPDDPVLSGWVQRVERSPELTQSLAQQSCVNKAQWYGEHGFWYDMMEVLAFDRDTCPEMWQSILTSFGLEQD